MITGEIQEVSAQDFRSATAHVRDRKFAENVYCGLQRAFNDNVQDFEFLFLFIDSCAPFHELVQVERMLHVFEAQIFLEQKAVKSSPKFFGDFSNPHVIAVYKIK